ncbi:hypothetical protein STVIR_1354 [Streptomyces viridochromogenes Tue57]|uniref:Uncharacterized protein n=1 Tax=Streptomyces viridochromogenes Tue57 TaxID=1160705 RepID=L8PJC1_STRVR|nr:hypothetical protein STVIR_1354 [Streptomyces viridochromogenes Tue57]
MSPAPGMPPAGVRLDVEQAELFAGLMAWPGSGSPR